jgi:nitrate reductase cytochrome c-type subunit
MTRLPAESTKSEKTPTLPKISPISSMLAQANHFWAGLLTAPLATGGTAARAYTIVTRTDAKSANKEAVNQSAIPTTAWSVMAAAPAYRHVIPTVVSNVMGTASANQDATLTSARNATAREIASTDATPTSFLDGITGLTRFFRIYPVSSCKSCQEKTTH